MKRKILFLSLMVLLSGCGGRGGGDDVLFASLLVNLSGGAGGPATSRTLRVQGNGINYTCAQLNDPVNNPNDPRCSVPGGGQGSIDTPITFTGLPVGGTYTFTEVTVSGTGAAGSCSITILTTSTTDPPTATAANPIFQCDLDNTGTNPLVLTIQIV